MSQHEDANAGATPREVILMRAGGIGFAVYAEECERVTDWAEPAPLPHAPAPVLGVVSVRGRMRTLLDPARLFEPSGLGTSSREEFAHVVSLAGDEQLALACETHAAATVAAGELQPAPQPNSLPVRATFRLDGQTVHLLDPARLFDAAMSGTERRRQRVVNNE